jgi:hypothetical protein
VGCLCRRLKSYNHCQLSKFWELRVCAVGSPTSFEQVETDIGIKNLLKGEDLMSKKFFVMTLVFLLIFIATPFRAECNKADVIGDIATAKPVVKTVQSSGALLWRCTKPLWKVGMLWGPPIGVILAGFYAKKHREQRQEALLAAFLMGALTSYYWVGWPMVEITSSSGWWPFASEVQVKEFSLLRLIGTVMVGFGGARVASYIADSMAIESVDDDMLENMAEMAEDFTKPYLEDEK